GVLVVGERDIVEVVEYEGNLPLVCQLGVEVDAVEVRALADQVAGEDVVAEDVVEAPFLQVVLGDEVVEVGGAVPVPVGEADADLQGGAAFPDQCGDRNAQKVQKFDEVRYGTFAGAEHADRLAFHQCHVELRIEFLGQEAGQPPCRAAPQDDDLHAANPPPLYRPKGPDSDSNFLHNFIFYLELL